MTAPLLKWVGGKRRLLPHLLPRLAPYLRPGVRYLEPFLGSGAVFFALAPQEALLGDASAALIATYRAVRQDPGAVAAALAPLAASPPTEAAYLQVRGDFNAARAGAAPGPLQAARFLYLNRRGFNGLWRQNLSGGCNTPWGGVRTAPLPSLDDLSQAARALRPAYLWWGDFRAVVEEARAGDVLYCDPPYLGAFTGYAGGFSEGDQRRLAVALYGATRRGAWVFLSQSDHPLAASLYPFLTPEAIPVYHAVGAKGDRRGVKMEYLFTNAPPLEANSGHQGGVP